ncbi:class III poly(R)-hydroxyalkanoic acid synthase subunit PhaE [Marilutibacter chinensis]|uniref:Poly(3-hydroxyalkanoate) polymerase subunit PhaE n=1 Tax=Marilutibacter chinensis TaxID=2912247 RepID=A0ABS9HY59_9GAMM|nr:class III poly(R)-hydroxyalkanoic acid synthase subunit PhaE [Lysobacter chinensis]MCF7223115.1 class III poly(R)-hydroxyalkanoic acid synthase subunit PhaE [Lysobacter chinensis]
MANNPFGGDFESLAKQYWNQWGEMMRTGAAVPDGGASTRPGSASPTGVPGWDEAIGWWSQLARGAQPDANAAVGRFDRQARDWFGRIQQLAAGFAGQNPPVSEIVETWKQMLGGGQANPFADVFASMGGRGQQGFDQWMEQAAPFIAALQGEGRNWLGMPAFGFSREHQQRWQRIARLHLDYQQRSQACNALMAEAGQRAFRHFERKLEAHAEPGRQLGSARALFDLWIDAAEEAYAEVAMSARYREDFGEMVNAQMRLRAAIQHEVELVAGLFGMPSRTEIDSAHRKIVQLERELRRLRDAWQAEAASVAAEGTTTRNVAGASSTGRAARPPAKKTAAGKVAAKKAPVGKAAAKKKTPASRTASKGGR